MSLAIGSYCLVERVNSTIGNPAYTSLLQSKRLRVFSFFFFYFMIDFSILRIILQMGQVIFISVEVPPMDS